MLFVDLRLCELPNIVIWGSKRKLLESGGDGRVYKGKEIRSTVLFKVSTHPPGDVRDAGADEQQSSEIKRYQPPWAVLPWFRGEKANVGCCLTQRKLQHVKQQPRASVTKGKTWGPKSEPWRAPVKAASENSCFTLQSLKSSPLI